MPCCDPPKVVDAAARHEYAQMNQCLLCHRANPCSRSCSRTDGTVVGLPCTIKSNRRRLAAAQRAAARRVKGSRNRAKAPQSRGAARKTGAVQKGRRSQGNHDDRQEPRSHRHEGPEDRRHHARRQRHGRRTRNQHERGRLISIGGCSTCRLAWSGSTIVVVDPTETSQRCNACGTENAASRISRSRFVCTKCSDISDADAMPQRTS